MLPWFSSLHSSWFSLALTSSVSALVAPQACLDLQCRPSFSLPGPLGHQLHFQGSALSPPALQPLSSPRPGSSSKRGSHVIIPPTHSFKVPLDVISTVLLSSFHRTGWFRLKKLKCANTCITRQCAFLGVLHQIFKSWRRGSYKLLKMYFYTSLEILWNTEGFLTIHKNAYVSKINEHGRPAGPLCDDCTLTTSGGRAGSVRNLVPVIFA